MVKKPLVGLVCREGEMLNVPLSFEFIYLLPGDVSRGYNDWDFKKLQSKLQAIKQRGRQAIVRINFGASCEENPKKHKR